MFGRGSDGLKSRRWRRIRELVSQGCGAPYTDQAHPPCFSTLHCPFSGLPHLALPPLTCLSFQLGLRPVTPEQMLGVIEEPLATLARQAGLYRPALSLQAWGLSGGEIRECPGF